jgi:hypothetical protein
MWVPAGARCRVSPSERRRSSYVVERGGKVWIVENGVRLETPFLDISDAVGAWRDYGMLGFAVHPNFEQNGYFYVFYVVDRYYLYNHGTPGYDPGLLESQQFQATIGRLSRFTADPATGRHTVLPGSEVILIGATPQDGLPILHESHGTGQVVFGQDGTLLVSAGDGASYAHRHRGAIDVVRPGPRRRHHRARGERRRRARSRWTPQRKIRIISHRRGFRATRGMTPAIVALRLRAMRSDCATCTASRCAHTGSHDPRTASRRLLHRRRRLGQSKICT